MRQVSVSELMRPILTTAQTERASFEHVQNSGANFLVNAALTPPWLLKNDDKRVGCVCISHWALMETQPVRLSAFPNAM
jgi:hypothetical protein